MSPAAIATGSPVASQFMAATTRRAAGGETENPQQAAAAGQTATASADFSGSSGANGASAASATGATNTGTNTDAAGKESLSAAEERVLAQLQRRDDEVRAHEMAHLSASGGLAVGGASFSYQTGPDGKRYAVGGEVNIDTSAGRTPEETLQKAEQIRSAALAPAEPSAQDRKVAAEAGRMAAQARLDIAAAERTEQAASTGGGKAQALDRLIGGVQPSGSASRSIDTYA